MAYLGLVNTIDVEGRWHAALVQRENGKDGFDSTRGSQQVARGPLGRRHSKVASVRSENLVDGPRFGEVPKGRRRCMCIQVVDLARLEAGFPQRLTHALSSACAVLGRGRDMMCISRHAVSEYLYTPRGRKEERDDDAFASDPQKPQERGGASRDETPDTQGIQDKNNTHDKPSYLHRWFDRTV